MDDIKYQVKRLMNKAFGYPMVKGEFTFWADSLCPRSPGPAAIAVHAEQPNAFEITVAEAIPDAPERYAKARAIDLAVRYACEAAQTCTIVTTDPDALDRLERADHQEVVNMMADQDIATAITGEIWRDVFVNLENCRARITYRLADKSERDREALTKALDHMRAKITAV